MIIVGAGMAGLLAAAMLRDEAEAIYELQPKIPNNHSAVLRFRSSTISDVLNIPFRKVDVYRATMSHYSTKMADAMSYSMKTNGSAHMRSIKDTGDKFVERYVAPPDLIQRMVAKVQCPIHLGAEFDRWGDKPTISTIPMPMLMKELGWKGTQPEFKSRHGVNIIILLSNDVDAYGSIYVPNPDLPFSRLSLTGNEIIAECYGVDLTDDEIDRAVDEAVNCFGFNRNHVMHVESKMQTYAKILPIDERVRRQFMMWATDEWNVYSLGRFATWRPGLLLDDLVNDVRVIQRISKNTDDIYSYRRMV